MSPKKRRSAYPPILTRVRQTERSRTIACIAAWLIYPPLLVWLAPSQGPCATMIGVVPPVLVAWIYGLAPGLLAAIIAFPLNTALMAQSFAGFESWLFSPSHLVGHGGLLLLCAAAGRSADVRYQLLTEGRQQRVAAAAVKRHEAQNVALLEALPDLALLLDEVGRISRCHSALPANYPMAYGQAVGQRLVELLDPSVAERLQENIVQVTTTGETRVMEFRAANQLGHERAYEARVLRATNGRLAVVLRDITEQKELDRDRAEVERVAREEAQLKSIFLANMSHEIRTPLNAIMGLTNLLLDTDLSEEQLEQLQTIHASGDTLLRVINDVLDYSKIEAGKLDLQWVDFDLRTTTEDVAELFAPAARRRGLDLSLIYASDAPLWVQGDPTRVSQVLNNLLSNALKFSDEGEVVLEVRSAPEAKPDDDAFTVEFSVRDTGIGIPPDRHHAVFDVFSQLDSSMTRRHQGTGLGLTICRQLIEIMGGTISVASAPGEGSTFLFSIPFQIPEEEYLSTASLAIDLAGRQALCLENQPSHQRELQHITALGMGLTVVTTAGAARRALAAEGAPPFDVVIASAELLDSEELVPLPQGSAPDDMPPLIVLASTSCPEDADRARRAGASAYLLRPVRFRKLRECLYVLFGLKPSDEYTLITQQRLPSFEMHIPAKILLVEDNRINQKVAVKLLDKMGCAVVTADHGRQAHAALLEDNFDLVLMDCQMPEMDGFEATALIRSDPRIDRRIPIIALTAHAMKGDRERCLAAGMNDYLTKPIDVKELERVLRRFGTPQEGGSPPPTPPPRSTPPPDCS